MFMRWNWAVVLLLLLPGAGEAQEGFVQVEPLVALRKGESLRLILRPGAFAAVGLGVDNAR
ncbi:hypothetical protein POL68_21225 [Stigmatella sp. ncwal1]|uniref:Uncharacterized protein n=1 Tax=Stigmatella ashevillensis TaxID=2995309 RepID=A0ABT5DBH6_9BACT|nr:hypothetical protein [Stigmatella ashevillena]MDC0711007.1 hypothetical protein [Stigmatella ashevillena]